MTIQVAASVYIEYKTGFNDTETTCLNLSGSITKVGEEGYLPIFKCISLKCEPLSMGITEKRRLEKRIRSQVFLHYANDHKAIRDSIYIEVNLTHIDK